MFGKKKKQEKLHKAYDDIDIIYLENEKDFDSDKKGRKKREKKRGRFWILRLFLRIFLILFLLAILAGIAGIYGANWYFEKLTGSSILSCISDAKKTVEESSEEDFMPNETSYIYSSENTVIATLSDGASTNYLTFNEIPQDVIQAFIAVEDQTYWSNPGYDIKGMARVLRDYYKSDGATAHGASTITQQLSRTIFLSTEKSIERKVREIFIAREITGKYSKEQIMEYYVNNCCFANSVYGIEDAAKTYLGKPASELTLSETAYLCAIPNWPEHYDPYKDYTTALTRRDKILRDMKSCGYISEEECAQALSENITIQRRYTTSLNDYPTTYAVKCVTEYLMKQGGFHFRYQFKDSEDYKAYNREYNDVYTTTEHQFRIGGYKVYTSLSLEKTEKLQAILDEQLSFSEDVNPETGIYNLQGAMTVVNNDTYKVEAIIGGRSQQDMKTTYSLNRAFQSNRQPGSTIKPLIVYTPAMMLGLANQTTSLVNVDVQEVYENPTEVQEMDGKRVSLKSAVTSSLNGCAIYLFDQVRPRMGLSFLSRMGFANIVPDDYNLSSGLGGLTYGTTTEEMANAYMTLQNHGTYVNVDCINSILDNRGNEVYEKPEEKLVYTREAADSMTEVMENVVKYGTGWSTRWSRYSKLPAAGKTGTTNDSTDGWFCGYTPYYTISVWVGNDDHTDVSRLYGGTYPAEIWRDSMVVMTEGKDEREFLLSPIDPYK